MNGLAAGLLEYFIASARRPGDRFTLRAYPFRFRIAPADPIDQERDVQYELAPDKNRVLLYMTFTAVSPTILTALPTGGSAFSLDRIEILLKHSGFEILEPEPAADSGGALTRVSYFHAANHYSANPFPDGAGGNRFQQQASGGIPLLHSIGPGGLLQIGGVKKLAAGVGEEWYIFGLVHSIKT